jgi:hypothetical protein
MTLARVAGASSRRVVYIAAAVDSMLAIGALALSGGIASPLWWTVLIGALGVALQDGQRGALATGGLATAAAVLVVAGLDPAARPAIAGAGRRRHGAVLRGGAAWPRAGYGLWRSRPVKSGRRAPGRAPGRQLARFRHCQPVTPASTTNGSSTRHSARI